jgi:hypothetical protein
MVFAPWRIGSGETKESGSGVFRLSELAHRLAERPKRPEAVSTKAALSGAAVSDTGAGQKCQMP